MIPARVRLLGRATAPRPFADTLVRLVRYQARQTMPAHSHDWFGLTLVLAGTLEEAVEERTAVCGPLTLILKPAGSQHATRVGPEGALTVHFELARSAVRTLVAHRLETRACAFYLAGPAAGALLELLAPREGCRETCIAGLLADVVAGRAAASPPVDTAAAAEFGRGVLGGSTGASAAALGMHRVSLARAFRREMGVAPCLWRMQQRLSRAAGALAAGEESAACIADAAGFSDQAHLCRLFRRETGLTPGRYRALVRYLAGERSSDAAGR